MQWTNELRKATISCLFLFCKWGSNIKGESWLHLEQNLPFKIKKKQQHFFRASTLKEVKKVSFIVDMKIKHGSIPIRFEV